MSTTKPTRLLCVHGHNPFENLTELKKNPDWVALARMRQLEAVQRVYVFSAPDASKGVDIVRRKEYVIPVGQHLRVVSSVEEKYIYRTHDFWIRTRLGQPQRQKLSALAARYLLNEQHAPWIEQTYPALVSLLKDAPKIHAYLQDVSVYAVMKHKLFSVEKLRKYVYPYLWDRLTKDILSRIDVWRLNREQLNEWNLIGKHYPDFNTHLESMLVNTEKHVVDLGLKIDTMKICKAYLHPFKFTWSMRRTTEVHDKLYKDYTRALMQHDPKPLNIAAHYYRDYQKEADFLQGFEARMLTTSGELAAEGQRMTHCVATYQGKCNGGECAILHVNLHNEHATLELNKQYSYGSSEKQRGMEPVKLYIGQLRAHFNHCASPELTRACNYLVEQLNEEAAVNHMTEQVFFELFARDPNNTVLEHTHQNVLEVNLPF